MKSSKICMNKHEDHSKYIKQEMLLSQALNKIKLLENKLSIAETKGFKFNDVKFHKEQKKTAKKIIKKMKINKKQILFALMQSGKSGTFTYVMLKMLDDEIIDNCKLISGNREISFKEQAIQSCDDFVTAYCNSGKTNKSWSELREKIEVWFGDDINLKTVENDTLIVHDESHYGSSKNQTIDDFYKRNNLNLVMNNKDFDEINKRNIYLLSVSATPFAEFINNIEDQSIINFLETNENYIGALDYKKNKKFSEIFKIDKNVIEFKNILSKYINTNKYLLIRAGNSKKNNATIINICKELNYKIIAYDQSNSRDVDINDILSIIPEQTTVILLKGLIKMGKVIKPKSNIGMVWETFSKNDSSFQGLIGRSFGYDIDKNNLAEIYAAKDCINKLIYYAECFIDKKIPYIDNSMNVKKQKKNKNKSKSIQKIEKLGGVPIIPIKLDPSVINNNNINNENIAKTYQKIICDYILNTEDVLKDQDPVQLNDIIKELKMVTNENSVSYRFMQNSKYSNIYPQFKNALEFKKLFFRSNWYVSSSKLVFTFIDSSWEKCNEFNAKPGEIWITGYTSYDKNKKYKYLENDIQTIPLTTENEIFNKENINEFSDKILSHHSSNDINILMNELSKFIESSIKNKTPNNIIYSCNNENKKQNYLLFSQDEFEWKNISNNKLKQDLFPELEIKHNVEINFTKTRGKWIRNDDTKWYYKVHGIKWELKK
jgi:hypothetical protein